MQYLYRAYDSQKNLLYVGISGKWHERLHAHEKTSEWIEQADWVKIERYSDRDSVEAAEKLAIRSEKPKFNKVFSEDYESAANHWAVLKKAIKSGKAKDNHHQLLIDMIRISAKDVYECNPSKLQSAGMAFLFFDLVEWLVYNTDYQPCRNCAGVWNMNFVQNSREIGESQLLGEEYHNGTN